MMKVHLVNIIKSETIFVMSLLSINIDDYYNVVNYFLFR